MKHEALETLKSRRSCRKYLPEQITEAELNAVLEAGTYAPTGMGSQSPVIVAVQNMETRNILSQMNAKIMGVDFDPFYGAPTILVVLASKSSMTYLNDGTCVLANLLNAAHAVGLGSCWIHRAKEEFESEEGKALLKSWGLAGDLEGIGHCALGYPDGELPNPAPRKDDYIVRK